MDVACLLVPEFLVALARREHPELTGRPVVVGGAPEEHAAVTACSQEAAAAGVTVGTTLRRALALCPRAVFLPVQEGFARAEAEAFANLVRERSPLVEVVAPGHVHCEIRGLARLVGVSEEVFLEQLQDSISARTRLPVQVGAARSVFVAHVAAAAIHDSRFAIHDSGGFSIDDFRLTPGERVKSQTQRKSTIDKRKSALLVPAGTEREFLAKAPVDVLPVEPVMHVRLRLLGLEWLGQVAEIPISAMQAQFGPEGARARALARGEDDSRIVPQREEVQVTEEIELPAPAASCEPLVVGTEALLQRALANEAVRGQTVRRVDWWLGLESGERVSRRVVFREPTSDAHRMLFVLRGKIERLELDAAAVGVGVTLSGLCSEYAHQGNLWQIGPRRQRELEEAIEQLNVRTGEAQVYRVVEVQPWSRIPERQVALVAFGS
jgi:DNA polymerase-4/protein ImuB